MHVTEIGEGPVVLFVHGFPELWYTRRHQMLYISSKGYRAITPDLRGFGDSEAPPSSTSYMAFHVVGDLVCLLDSLGLDKVFLVGHDWGAIISWYLCLFRPDRIKALVNMSVVYKPRNPSVKPVDLTRHTFGDDFYICRFQVIISIFYYLLFFYIIRIIRLMIILCMHIPTKYVQRSDVFLRLS